ncbi:hypothetical protein, partial [Zhenhengia yiwuensis]|uniref:hypothetical protein n=1 Tax=Zhenhengia yiwuensis TaxID=2763666 RepID=UPI002A754CFE
MKRKNSLSQVFYLGMAAVMMTGSVVGCSSAEDKGKEQTKQEGPLTLEAVALVNALSGDFNQMDI